MLFFFLFDRSSMLGVFCLVCFNLRFIFGDSLGSEIDGIRAV
uniref:Uncharacterized protein n=1 Tax=Rhizophora mucronata TaxID=61149 RepID=A0A2P2QW93_RHIMU